MLVRDHINAAIAADRCYDSPWIGPNRKRERDDAEREVTPTHAVHPLGARAKVLLSSVFGPYAQDDEYGSRTINPI